MSKKGEIERFETPQLGTFLVTPLPSPVLIFCLVFLLTIFFYFTMLKSYLHDWSITFKHNPWNQVEMWMFIPTLMA